MIHPAATLAAIEIHREAAARPPAEIVVRRGDSLSGIAARYRVEWPGLYEANRAVIGENPNLLNPGAPAHTVRGVGSAPGRDLPADRGPRRGTIISANGNGGRPGRAGRASRVGGLFPGMRHLQGERRRRPGHERKWPLRPLPVQLLRLGRSGRQPRRLRECVRRRAEPGVRHGIRRGRDLTVGAVRRLLMRTPGHQATAGN